ncbi:MAG: hypothetical protein ACYTEL_16835 [Planctomycetota bacterium]|jgi:hypothetical protein
MRLIENIEKFIRVRKPHFTTSSDTDKRILDDSFTAMEAAQAQSKRTSPTVWAIVLRSRATRLAAAVILMSIGFLVYWTRGDRTDTPKVLVPTRSSAEMMTAMSLKLAYRRGGLEEVENQCNRALEMLGPLPPSVTLQELSEELKGM